MFMRVKILGSGGWEGIPAPFCNCRVCESAKDPKSKDNRTRPSIAVETDKGKFLIEISPDIRMQSAKCDLSGVNDFLVSHWHFDHMYGLMELHAWAKFVANEKARIYCSEKTKEWLDKNFAHIPKEIIVVRPFMPFDLFGVKITPIPVYHMLARDTNISADKLSNTFGYVLELGGKRIVYLPDYYKIPKESLELVKGSDAVILDGTYLFEELFPDKPEQNGEKSDPDHLHGKQVLNFAKSLKAKNTVFHSITHLSEKRHDELQKLLPNGMLISYDGMELDV
jgi:phosphoribosyl 1,2-cyclic phosphate phosphodiesterase